ncbi:MAG TPA: hypothetical protein VFB12_18975 [Ktedonobacteraceae bacterium]|nr:hypothetical protein [Ktedonobacteraceae bacterium]
MRPLPERLNDRLEQQIAARSGKTQQEQYREITHSDDAEIERLVALAQRLQTAPALQVEAGFARRLERRLLAQQAVRWSTQATKGKRIWRLQYSVLRTAIVLTTVVLCMLLLGTGVLLAAERTTNSGSPLYQVKRWEQGVQKTLASSPVDKAELDRQSLRDQLHGLANVADADHTEAYDQAIANLDQQIHSFIQTINGLPGGSDHQRLLNELEDLKTETRQTLRELLPRLTIAERQTTTNELGRLGDSVPELTNASMVLTMQPKEEAIISITGSHLLPQAQLLVNDQPAPSIGILQNGVYVFMLAWTGQQAPTTLGIMDHDDTVAQTKTITLTIINNSNKLVKTNISGNDKADKNNNNNNGKPINIGDNGNSSNKSINIDNNNNNGNDTNGNNGNDTNGKGSNNGNGHGNRDNGNSKLNVPTVTPPAAPTTIPTPPSDSNKKMKNGS